MKRNKREFKMIIAGALAMTLSIANIMTAYAADKPVIETELQSQLDADTKKAWNFLRQSAF